MPCLNPNPWGADLYIDFTSSNQLGSSTTMQLRVVPQGGIESSILIDPRTESRQPAGKWQCSEA